MADSDPRPRSGHDLDPCHRAAGAGPRSDRDGAAGIAAAFPRPRIGRARARRSVAGTCSRYCEMRWPRPARSSPTLPELASPTSARPGTWCGTGAPASRSIARSSGRIVVPLTPAPPWREADHGPMIAERTGLVIDPYFSATKLAWLLDHVPEARARAERGDLAFGTVDTFLLWRLTGGRVHATDATNASRTMLFDIRRGVWDEELLALFRIPALLLPEVRDCAGGFGMTVPDIIGSPVRILGVAGDQQAAAIGQACFQPGMVKATYGTGAFILMNTGDQPVASHQQLLTTIAWQFRGGAPMRWRAPSSWPAPRCNGCATRSACCGRRPMRRGWRRRPSPSRGCISCPHSPDLAPLTGIPRRAARCSGSPCGTGRRNWRVRRWRAWPTRPAT